MRHPLAAVVITFALASPALAQDSPSPWYVGAALGLTQARFEPFYTFVNGSDPEQFDNRERGLQADIVGGWRRGLNDAFTMAVQGMLSVNRIEWSLSIPDEPADLRYSLPYTLVVSAIPSWDVGRGISVFAEVGAGMGRVRERKTSPVESSYDVDVMAAALHLGVGAAVPLTDRLDLVAAYRHGRYAPFEFDTFNPDGAVDEHVTDAPRTHGVSVGVTIGF